MIWKDEAFSCWVDEWAFIYGLDSDSYKFIEKVKNNFYLMNVVDNDFVNGNLYNIFNDFIDKHQAEIDKLK